MKMILPPLKKGDRGGFFRKIKDYAHSQYNFHLCKKGGIILLDKSEMPGRDHELFFVSVQ